MSANYSQRQIQVEFTHEGLIMGKICNYLLMTKESRAKNRGKLPMSKASCKANDQNLYMTNSICKENSTFLYISFFTLLLSLYTEENGHTKF
jgi:hypothetical protein